MKFIIRDYSSPHQTEPYYLNASINLLDGCSSVLWQHTMCSLYDILDYIKADIFLCHAAAIPEDIIHYIKENKKPDIILNITDIPEKQMQAVERYLLDNDVRCWLFFSNKQVNQSAYKTKTITVLPGADVFLNTEKDIDYRIDNCYIVNTDNDLNGLNEAKSYHTISTVSSMENKADVIVGAVDCGKLYKNYDNIIFKSYSETLPQMFFDAVYYAKHVDCEFEQEKLQQTKDIIKRILKLENLDNYEEIKNAVQNKHTCINRTKSILSQLPCQQQIKELDKYIQIYKDRTNNI